MGRRSTYIALLLILAGLSLWPAGGHANPPDRRSTLQDSQPADPASTPRPGDEESADEQPKSTGAEDSTESRRFSREFTGAFMEPDVRAALVGGPNFRGWSVDTGFRHSFPFLLGDLRLSYRFDKLQPRAGTPAPNVTSHSVSLHAALHPLYLALLWSDWFGYTLASLYVEAGIGGHANVISQPADAPADGGIHWSVGAGIDIPLADPDHGHAPWLHLLYRFTRRSVEPPGRPSSSMKLHSGFVGIGWRFNGMLF